MRTTIKSSCHKPFRLSRTCNLSPSCALSSPPWVKGHQGNGSGTTLSPLRLGRRLGKRKQSDKRKFHCLIDFVSSEIEIIFRIIFELIKGEMAYVKDLENIGNVGDLSPFYVRFSADTNPRCTSRPCARPSLLSFPVTG